MNKIYYEHIFVHNYFRCKEQISKVQTYRTQGKKVFCSLCFEPKCSHNLSLDSYNNTIEQLSMWQDVNFMYGKNRFLEQQKIPKFPLCGFDTKFSYIVKPKLDLPLSIISVKVNGGEKVGFTNNIIDEKLTNYANDNSFGEGIWYGYFDESFRLLTFFKGNEFSNLRRYDLPYKKVIGLEEVKFDMGIGLWYLPVVKHYHEFHRYLYEKCST